MSQKQHSVLQTHATCTTN